MSSEKEKTLNLADRITPNGSYAQLLEAVNLLATDEIKDALGKNAVELLVDGMGDATTIIGRDPKNEYCWFSLEFYHGVVSSWKESPISKDMLETMIIFYSDIGFMEIDARDNLRVANSTLGDNIRKIISSKYQ